MNAPRSPSTGLLRFATAGSVDDGKSTLIGRLLYDSKSLLADHLTAIEAASRRRGLSEPDLSLLTDGLIAEREQGITIDVAYRYFATPSRKFIISDSPGHVQYTRNMVTAASTADVAVLLVDARNGLAAQTRRHAYLSRWVGIRRVVLAVNKMDLVGFSRERFDAIRDDFLAFARDFGFAQVQAIPLSALHGDMVVDRGDALEWYDGPTLLEFLESVPARHDDRGGPLRLPVQRVVRVSRAQAQPHADVDAGGLRGYQGTIASGRVAVGDEIAVLPSGLTARVTSLHVLERAVDAAFADQAITVGLDREIDVSRGDVIVAERARPPLSTRVEAEVCWFDAEPLDRHRAYLMRHGTQTVRARVAAIGHRVDVETLERHPSPESLAMNDIGHLHLSVQRPLPFEPYRENRAGGAFVLIDEVTNRTVAAGTVA
ncbi:MAG: GTP-binding protein [Burkholderiaceae bacterium]